MKRFALIAVALTMAWSTQATAITKTFKYDEFSTSIYSAADEISTQGLSVQAAYGQGEAFGQIYRPEAGEYPVTIQGVDFFFAGPPNAETVLKSTAVLEVYIGPGDGPAPPADADFFSVSTADMMLQGAGADDGADITGNSAIRMEFNYDDPDGHPPTVQAGNNIWVMLRYPVSPWVEEEDWGLNPGSCMPCGCQAFGSMHDSAPTENANILNWFNPLAGCEQEANMWSWFEDLGGSGDIIMRMVADVNNAGTCEPNCLGVECGSDGCGGQCPSQCTDNQYCSGNQCVDTCTPSCDGKECGSDGCNGSCGTCGNGTGCNSTSGLCVAVDDDCSDKSCGDDGMGGWCGDCSSGLVCYENECVDPSQMPDDDHGMLTIKDVSPSRGGTNTPTNISIAGTGFQLGAVARLGGEPLGVFELSGDSLILAQVPAGMNAGIYTLYVINPDGETALKEDAFEVVAGGGNSDGCASAQTHPHAITLMWALGFCVFYARRKWHVER